MLLIGWKYAASNQKHYPDPVVTRHQYGISARVSQTPFRGETSGSIAKCRLFSQTSSSSPSWSLIFVVCFRTVWNKNQFNFCFGFRLKGLLCEGSKESPILHLRLLEPHETFEEDEEKLKEVVALVSCLCCLSHLFVNGKCSLQDNGHGYENVS